MPSLLEFAGKKQAETIQLVRSFVECESPTEDAPAVNRFTELIAGETRDLATPKFIRSARYGRHLRLEFKLPGRKKQGQILALGHADTVWPMGTLAAMPFRQAEGRLWGPGVLDMKAGLAFFIAAMRILRERDAPVARRVVMLVVSDEEVGSETSRLLTEAEARNSECVLVLEPGTGLTGKLKTARKGVGCYRVLIQGKAAHAGVDFENGASAILEAARQVEKIAGFTNLQRGTTVNPGLISGGTRTNVIAAEARIDVDIRIARLREGAALDKKFKALRAVDKRCQVRVEGGLNRPPMERSKQIAALFAKAQKIAREMGLHIEESSTGGGSDGNFTAALGIPTLDGLGGVGEGAHAVNESVLVERIADRVALLAGLVAAGEGGKRPGLY
jgi:glutamate carboxypeptidase